MAAIQVLPFPPTDGYFAQPANRQCGAARALQRTVSSQDEENEWPPLKSCIEAYLPPSVLRTTTPFHGSMKTVETSSRQLAAGGATATADTAAALGSARVARALQSPKESRRSPARVYRKRRSMAKAKDLASRRT